MSTWCPNPDGNGVVDTLPAFDRSLPISGTSYAAPVVSGLAALIRSRFPGLTARQVMQRIEATAHHPSRGWDPAVGNGVIDPLAAVSAEGAPRRPEPAPAAGVDAAAEPLATRPRDTALIGAGLCAAVLAAGSALARGRRRAGHHVVGGERGGATEHGADG